MSIPQDRIETPELIQASPGETLDEVRTRMKGPDGAEKWQACVLVRSEDGRYAVVSVFDLRPLLWKEGPAALKRRLRDLEVVHFQPGVEQDAVGLKEAEQLASQYGGYLVVLKSGRYAGLLQDRSKPRSTAFKPTGAFDLFDELIKDSDLTRTEFVSATPNTTVAQVARDLKPLQNARTAFVVVDKGDGTFAVTTTRQLHASTKDLGTQVWGMPLRQLPVPLRDAESRERRTLGYEQAQALADSRGFLVLTKAGKPVGLFPSRVILRAADLYEAATTDIAKGPTYGLFNVPEEVLDGYPAEATPEKKPRFANLWFADQGGTAVPKATPLRFRQTYLLRVNIGQLRLESIVGDNPPAILEPPQETQEGTTLYISLFSDDFDIPNPTQSLLLPPWADSLPAEFQVTPTRHTFGPNDKALLDLHIYYRCNLVQSWQVRVEVASPEQAPQTDVPQQAILLAARTQDYMALEGIGPRHVSLLIARAPDGAYQFDFAVAADEQADEVRLGTRVNLRREDLTHLITKARRQLYNIARSRAYQQDVAGDPVTFRTAIQALALLGRQLYSHLFEQGQPESGAGQVAAWIKKYLPEGSTIQVVDRAHDFVFPWSLVYDEIPWDRDGLSQKVNPGGFWGYRYRIELLTEDLIRTYQTKGAEMDTAAGLRIGVGLNEEIPWSKQQRGFFDQLSAECGEQAQYSFFESSPQLTQFLEKGDRHIFYVFCHGYTERMAADIQIGDDLIGEFRSWLNTLSAEQRTALKDQENALFDVSDSWIKLTYGTVPLTMMEHYAAPQLEDAPLVFLNMCESAQVLPSLSAGFIPFFLQRGARSIIGTECPMTSTFADPFAREFFRRFLQGQTVGQVLWDLRRRYLDEGNPLGFAYTLYGDANTKLSQAILKS
jgi:CBS domain-containing protein